VYCYVYLCTNSYVLMTIWCRELHGKRGCHETLKKALVEFPWEPWGLSHGVCCQSCAFGLLWFVVLDLLCLCLVYGHTILFVESCCYWFSWSSSYLFLIFPFMFWVSWELAGKEEIWWSSGRVEWNTTSNIRHRWSSVHE